MVGDTIQANSGSRQRRPLDHNTQRAKVTCLGRSEPSAIRNTVRLNIVWFASISSLESENFPCTHDGRVGNDAYLAHELCWTMPYITATASLSVQPECSSKSPPCSYDIRTASGRLSINKTVRCVFRLFSARTTCSGKNSWLICTCRASGQASIKNATVLAGLHEAQARCKVIH